MQYGLVYLRYENSCLIHRRLSDGEYDPTLARVYEGFVRNRTIIPFRVSYDLCSSGQMDTLSSSLSRYSPPWRPSAAAIVIGLISPASDLNVPCLRRAWF